MTILRLNGKTVVVQLKWHNIVVLFDSWRIFLRYMHMKKDESKR